MVLREARAACYRGKKGTLVEAQIASISSKLSSDLRSLAGAVRCADNSKERLMWGDTVVSNAEKAAVLASRIQKTWASEFSAEGSENSSRAAVGRDSLLLIGLLDAAYAQLFTMDAAHNCEGGFGGIPPFQVYMSTLVESRFGGAAKPENDNPLLQYHHLRQQEV
jgi:hypothetical protein